METPVVGGVYRFEHCRMGVFRARVVAVGVEWWRLEAVDQIMGMSYTGDVVVGQEFTVHASHVLSMEEVL